MYKAGLKMPSVYQEHNLSLYNCVLVTSDSYGPIVFNECLMHVLYIFTPSYLTVKPACSRALQRDKMG
jgi:hypothetical protein